MLALAISAIADRKRVRGGIVLGLPTALSLAIGLEMLIYLALAAAAMVLFWVADRDERERLGAYAVTLGGGTALAFLVFASYANRLAVCDALSPVWLSDALARRRVAVRRWPGCRRRTGSGGSRWRSAPALIVAAFHALMWPHCLQRLEGVSPEVERLWLSHVREARPIYRARLAHRDADRRACRSPGRSAGCC